MKMNTMLLFLLLLVAYGSCTMGGWGIGGSEEGGDDTGAAGGNTGETDCWGKSFGGYGAYGGASGSDSVPVDPPGIWTCPSGNYLFCLEEDGGCCKNEYCYSCECSSCKQQHECSTRIKEDKKVQLSKRT